MLRLCEESAWKCSDKDTLNTKCISLAIEDDGAMTRIGGVWNKKHGMVFWLEFFEGCLIIDECYHDITIFWCIGLLDEDEIPIIDSFFVHRVTFSTQKEIRSTRTEKFGRNWNLCFDIFFCKYRHTASNRTNEWNIFYLDTIGLKWWRYLDLIMCISIEPTFLYNLIEKYRYRSRGCISESYLKGSNRDLLTFREEFPDFLENELFLCGEFFHREKSEEMNYIQCIQTYIYRNKMNANKKLSTMRVFYFFNKKYLSFRKVFYSNFL